MESLPWTFLVAVVLMGAAGAGAVILIVADRCPRRSAVVYAVAWFLLCFAPLAWAWLSPSSSLIGVAGSLDYAGAMPFAIAIGIGGIMMALVSAPQKHPVAPRPSPVIRLRWASSAVAILASTGAVAGWLVVAEGQLNDYAIGGAVSVVVMSCCAVATSLLLRALRRRRPQPWATLAAVVAALAAAVGAAAYVGVVASGAVGIVSAVLGHAVAIQTLRRTASGELALSAAAATGGVLGLLSLGLLDRSSGFFYSGQPTLVLTQVQLVCVGAVFAALACGVIAALIRFTGILRR
ncbi:hypothetical protein [Homoserinimonas hongtaonis]|uniref:Ammonium transporter AmtB-like domain-containing protein n=1 Tax=Homoserinimonas hongtaonis TaxID=2079791 RepID=A0A2U1SYS0_9MICO|nr:hypothetical protein [Salinibacterium hongtaonis]PWB96759.1 hypothetical protein DF220_02115 [Salinibacterium hongtaonis]